MITLLKGFCCLSLLVACAFPQNAGARHQIEFESTYLGDGWFRYQLTMREDPYFQVFDIGGFGLNQTTIVDSEIFPANWIRHTNGSNASWDATNHFELRPRPYNLTFQIHSTETSFRKQAFGAIAVFSLVTVGGYHGEAASLNMVGYVNLDCLVPCAADEADGSPTNLLRNVSLGVPDIAITRLRQSAGSATGLEFSYTEESTVRLDASRNLRDWVGVAYLFGNPGVTIWSTNRPLTDFGDYFRLLLVAEGHETNLPPLNASGFKALAPGKLSPVTAIQANPRLTIHPGDQSGTVRVQVSGTPGGRYEIMLLGEGWQPIEARQVLLRGSTGDVVFTGVDPQKPAMFRAMPLE